MIGVDTLLIIYFGAVGALITALLAGQLKYPEVITMLGWLFVIPLSLTIGIWSISAIVVILSDLVIANSNRSDYVAYIAWLVAILTSTYTLLSGVYIYPGCKRILAKLTSSIVVTNEDQDEVQAREPNLTIERVNINILKSLGSCIFILIASIVLGIWLVSFVLVKLGGLLVHQMNFVVYVTWIAALTGALTAVYTVIWIVKVRPVMRRQWSFLLIFVRHSLRPIEKTIHPSSNRGEKDESSV